MAQKVQVSYVDDIDGSEADGTVAFAMDGTSFEIDLSASNGEKFRQALAPFIEHARRASGVKRGVARQRDASNRQRTHDIREWAKAQGMTISGRGRIPADVISKYQAAHR
jgi:hypothetical protein